MSLYLLSGNVVLAIHVTKCLSGGAISSKGR